MWYALFDFEHDKDDHEYFQGESSIKEEYQAMVNARNPDFNKKFFMKHPHLYKIGMEYRCFTMPIFVRWLILGALHALLIYMVCFYAIDQIQAYMGVNGLDNGFWVAGHVVFTTCVFVANVVCLHRFNTFTGYGELTVSMMISSYILTYAIMSLMQSKDEVFGTFSVIFGSPLCWFCIIFCSLQVSVFEYLIKAINSPNLQGGQSHELYRGSYSKLQDSEDHAAVDITKIYSNS